MSNDFNRGSFTRVQEIHSMLHPKPSDLLNPSRFFVREGDLFMWNKKKSKKSNRHFFLFNDIMLLCKKQGSKRYFLRIHITLRSPYVSTESIETSSHASEFRLHCKTRSFILYATTDEERKGWLRDMQNSITGNHPEEKGSGGEKDYAEFEEKKEKTRRASQNMQTAPMANHEKVTKASRSQSTAGVPAKKSSSGNNSNRDSKIMTNPGSQTDRGPQRAQSLQPQAAQKKKRAKDDTNVRPKSMMETQQLQSDSSLFVYNSPTVTNNPFLDVQPQQQNAYAQNSNPFATNNAFHNPQSARAQSMMMPQPQSFGNISNNARPQSMIVQSNPQMGYNANPFATTTPVSNPNPFATNVNTAPNPFATNVNTPTASNPFATNVNTNKSVANPFLTNVIPQQSAPQQNPFATTGGY